MLQDAGILTTGNRAPVTDRNIYQEREKSIWKEDTGEEYIGKINLTTILFHPTYSQYSSIAINIFLNIHLYNECKSLLNSFFLLRKLILNFCLELMVLITILYEQMENYFILWIVPDKDRHHTVQMHAQNENYKVYRCV